MKQRNGTIGYILIAICVIIFVIFFYDLLLTPPDHLEGVIIEKIFIPSSSVAANTPYGGVRRSNYFITSQKEEQWVAIVKMDNGEIMKVHCHPHHYQQQNVGDVIHFRKYEGKLLHILYFAHNEEE